MPIGVFSTDFADWLDYSVTRYPWTGYDKYGGPLYGSSSILICYKTEVPTLITSAAGYQVVSKAQLYMPGNTSINILDKLVQADGHYPPIHKIDQFYNDKSLLEVTVVYI